MFKFYLGTHETHWLNQSFKPLFVSINRFRKRSWIPKDIQCDWALDSGGFTELTLHGKYIHSYKQYASEVQHLFNTTQPMDFAAPQDWMCEPFMIKKTGLSIARHQVLTTVNFIQLQQHSPHLPFIPVIQGYSKNDYLRHIDLYDKMSINLSSFDRVGVGSVCRRQHTDEIKEIFEAIKNRNIKIHAFGVKTQGLIKYQHLISSADSMAWSFQARHRPPLKNHQHKTCSNCISYAFLWRENLIQKLRQKAIT